MLRGYIDAVRRTASMVMDQDRTEMDTELPLTMIQDAVSQAPFAALLIRADSSLTLLWRNRAHAVMSGSLDLDIENRPMFEAFPPNDDDNGAAAKEAIYQSVARIRETKAAEEIGPYRFDLRDEHGSFVEHHWQMKMSPVELNNEVVAILQVAEDVTHSVLYARMAETLKRAARSTAAVSYFSYDPGTDAFSRSPDVDEMFGYAKGEAGTAAAPFFERVHPDDLPGVQAEVQRVFSASKGEVASFDYRVGRPDGTERFLRIRAEVATDPADRRDKLMGTFVDLTDIEESRRSLARALRSQEMLVAEANHRIKNSLAIAISMLRMEQSALAQRDAIDPSEAALALASVGARIRAVSDAHGLMQLNKGGTTVSLKSLIERLVSYARQTANLESHQFECVLPAHDVSLISDTAITLGLILSEVVTNALKYGVQGDGGTNVRLTCVVSETDIAVTVENTKANEKGIVNIPSTKLGSQIVKQLTDQLEGEIQSTETPETYRTELKIPLRCPD